MILAVLAAAFFAYLLGIGVGVTVTGCKHVCSGCDQPLDACSCWTFTPEEAA